MPGESDLVADLDLPRVLGQRHRRHAEAHGKCNEGPTKTHEIPFQQGGLLRPCGHDRRPSLPLPLNLRAQKGTFRPCRPPPTTAFPKLGLARTWAVLGVLARHLWPKGETGAAHPRRRRAGAAGPGQARQRLRADPLQADRRRAGHGGGAGRGRADRPHRGLRRGPGTGAGVRRNPRRGVRAGVAAGDPQPRPRSLRPSPCALAALPSRAPDRRPEPRHRARHHGHGVPDPLHDLQHPADPARDRPGRRHPVEPLRLALLGGDPGRHRRLHRVLGRAVGVAHQVRAPHERRRHRGQRQGDRQPAELRDRQVFRQRGARGAPLRCRPAALRDGGDPLQPHPVAAQHRPGRSSSPSAWPR